MATKKKSKMAEACKAQFTTTPDDERRIAAFIGRELLRGLIMNRAQALALLTRRGLDTEEREAEVSA